MKRFYVEELERVSEDRALIRGMEARHIAKVLRMGPGDRFVLMDGRGNRYAVSILSCTHREVRVELGETLPAPEPSPVRITLGQALIKPRGMDYVVQKSSELGAGRIIPFTSSRTAYRLDIKGREAKARHWREISRSAAKQSDRPRPLSVEPLASFEDVLAYGRQRGGLRVLLWEGEETLDLREVLAGRPPGATFTGLVGPEGGFTAGEVGLARDYGFSAASLGSRVLRAETAALALLVIVQYEWGDLGVGRS